MVVEPISAKKIESVIVGLELIDFETIRRVYAYFILSDLLSGE